ncbi:ATP-binding cassette domain-containing protein [Fictibacillus norfolkensis]|uniref:ATP-binding cassette domain-containing protein n=1 Tax=Fictibacillus norfolkensis TaxID=2762233 RepID=A0ABR8SKC5_9BACL|nr:ATP-binding cassette domain-containing protein [Fictibacillus norfolkensis]MBD7963941.1 ATP-binding cassette domain-containing protein [Fictibacillus norfolkensis]
MKLCTQIERVEKTVDDFTVGPIDLDIELGTITALIGNNGAGKSTLIKMMMNLVKPDNGLLLHFGTNIKSSEHWKQEVAYQPQSVLGCDLLTGNHLRDLMAPWYKNWDQEMFMNLVKTFEIDLNKRFIKMSKGMGKYEKEELAFRYKRYWFEDALGIERIPGEIDRLNDRLLISNDVEQTDTYLKKNEIKIMQSEVLEVEEIITYMLMGR